MRSRPTSRLGNRVSTTSNAGSVINVIQRENGDKVELSPFSVKKNIDATGIKYSIKLKPEPGWGSV
jgi:hypothetical protein